MRTTLVTAFIWLMFCSLLHGQKCAPPSRPTDDVTRVGGNVTVTLIEKRLLSRLQGKVETPNGEALGNALVEIYDNPAWIKLDKAREEQKRLIACEAAADGLFEITGLPKGDYELRISAGTGFNVSHVFISIDPRRGRKRRLYVTVELGT